MLRKYFHFFRRKISKNTFQKKYLLDSSFYQELFMILILRTIDVQPQTFLHRLKITKPYSQLV